MAKVSIFIFLIVNLTILSVACNERKQDNTYQFYYYPLRNIYYDVRKSEFLYSIDGAKTWQVFTGVSNPDVATLGDKEVITSSDSSILNKNEEHRRLYAGNLYSLDLSGEGLAGVTPVVSERKTSVKKIPAVKEKNSEKPKKGIAKFFSKIFHKSDKK
jgi:hypothetical protein